MGATTVDFGSAVGTSVNVTSPDHPHGQLTVGDGTVDVTVTTAGGTSATGASDKFTYIAPPTVTNVNPTSGPQAGGTPVTVTGTGFVSGSTSVHFGSTAGTSVSVTNSTTLTVNSPSGTGTVDVTVTTANGTSATGASDKFTYTGPPTVTNVNPTSGPQAGGTPVTVTGTGLRLGRGRDHGRLRVHRGHLGQRDQLDHPHGQLTVGDRDGRRHGDHCQRHLGDRRQ